MCIYVPTYTHTCTCTTACICIYICLYIPTIHIILYQLSEKLTGFLIGSKRHFISRRAMYSYAPKQAEVVPYSHWLPHILQTYPCCTTKLHHTALLFTKFKYPLVYQKNCNLRKKEITNFAPTCTHFFFFFFFLNGHCTR